LKCFLICFEYEGRGETFVEKVRERGSCLLSRFSLSLCSAPPYHWRPPPSTMEVSPSAIEVSPSTQKVHFVTCCNPIPTTIQIRFGYHITTITPLATTNSYPPDPFINNINGRLSLLLLVPTKKLRSVSEPFLWGTDPECHPLCLDRTSSTGAATLC